LKKNSERRKTDEYKIHSPREEPKLGDASGNRMHSTAKVKEADHVNLEPLAGVAKFRAWKSHFRKEVAGASGQPELAFEWAC
jgi:hypothetical protein